MVVLLDVHDKKTRSYNMSRIKGKNTNPEETVRKYLFSKGFRYRKNDKNLLRFSTIISIILPILLMDILITLKHIVQ